MWWHDAPQQTMLLTTQQSALTEKLRQNTSYLQLGGINNLFYAVMTVFAQSNGAVFAIQNLRRVWRFSPHLVTPLATLTDGHVVLIFYCNCKAVDSSRRPRKDKFGMVSETCN